MKKIYMPEQGINLDVCVDGCGGIYFDNRELSKFDEPHEDISPLQEVLKDKEFDKVDENMTRVCPVCGSDMVKNCTGPNKETVIDECYHCGGKFLDYGELDKMRSEYNTEGERSADVIKKLYSDVGSQLMERPAIAKNYRQNQGKKSGAVVGVVLALVWLIFQNEIIVKTISNHNANYDAFWVVIFVAVAIVALFSGIGSLLGRISK